jgi:hypothetical protein
MARGAGLKEQRPRLFKHPHIAVDAAWDGPFRLFMEATRLLKRQRSISGTTRTGFHTRIVGEAKLVGLSLATTVEGAGSLRICLEGGYR